jgi:hypothetical protein
MRTLRRGETGREGREPPVSMDRRMEEEDGKWKERKRKERREKMSGWGEMDEQFKMGS